MRAKRIDKWLSNSALNLQLKDKKILNWLYEEGSITSKISSTADFKLEVLNDALGKAKPSEYQDINIEPQIIRVREVVLYGDDKPVVYARSIIPLLASSKGYSSLGKIGNKPLGDLIFQSKLFIKTDRFFAKFKASNDEIVWGRKTYYLIKGYPFSIMEVFLAT